LTDLPISFGIRWPVHDNNLNIFFLACNLVHVAALIADDGWIDLIIVWA
jgi:hypothetical protein